MARLVVGAVGAAAGFLIGGPTGAQIGWIAGSTIGGLVDPPDALKQQGPRLGDLKIQFSSYGAMIPVVYGTTRVAGNVIWASQIREKPSTTTGGSGGGKGGGGGPETETTTYTYSIDLAVSFAEGPLNGIRRLWANGQLVSNFSGSSNIPTASVTDDFAESFKFYDGSESQMPDPTMEAALGVGKVPAYRGQAYVVFTDLQLELYGNRVPNFEFEVAVGGTFEGPKLVDTGLPAYAGTTFRYIDNSGAIWACSNASYTSISRYSLKSGVTLTARSIYSSLNTPISANAFLVPSAVGESGTLVCQRAGTGTGNSYLSTSGAEQYTSFRPPPPQEPNPQECQLQLFGPGTGFVVNSDRITVYSVYTSVGVFEEGSNIISYPGVYSQGFKYIANAGIAFDNTSIVSLSLTTKRLNISGAAALVLVQPSSISINPFGGKVACKLNSSGLSIFATGAPYINANGIVADSEGNYYVLNTTTKKIHKFLQTSPGAFTNSLTLDTTTVMPLWNSNVKIPSGKKTMIVLYNTTEFPTANSYRIGLIDLSSMTFVSSCAAPTNGLDLFESDSGTDIVAGIDSNTNTIKLVDYNLRFTASDEETTANLATIVSDLCARSNLDTATQVDVSALVPYKVAGYTLTRQASARQNIAQLQKTYFFDAVESDNKIKFVPRTQSPAVSIPLADLGGYSYGGQPAESLEVQRAQEVDLPARVNVTYPDSGFAYQVKTQLAQRIVTSSVVEQSEALSIVMPPEQALGVAKNLLHYAHIERMSFQFKTGMKYFYLEPTDVVVVNGPNKSYTVRLTAENAAGMVLEWGALAASGTGVAAAAPMITSPVTAGGVTGVSFTYQTVATNSPTAYSATSLPPGLSINAGTGAITGTPSSLGVFPATITATNAAGVGKSPLTFTITGSATAPTITSAAALAGKQGTAYQSYFTASGTTPTTWTVTVGSLPAGLTLNATTGYLSGTPTASGTFAFTIQAANGTAPNATQAVTATIQVSGATPPDITVRGPTLATYLDIPIVQDIDDDPGFYMAMAGAQSNWNGSLALKSSDNVNYGQIQSVTVGAPTGFCTTKLGAGPNTNMIDETSTVTVITSPNTVLSSITTDGLLNVTNLCVIGDEILCFGTATLIAANTYVLSRFIRGMFGTDRMRDLHVGGDNFTMLRSGGVIRVPGTTFQIGQSAFYKAVTFGQTALSAAPTIFTNNAVGLKPLSPVGMTAAKQPNGDFIITWTRRSRIDAQWRSSSDTPLGETLESYDLVLMNSSKIVRRTVTVTSPTYTYTLAQQTTDTGGGISAGALYYQIYQRSSTVGLGFGSKFTNQ
jgi:hypothetical protein